MAGQHPFDLFLNAQRFGGGGQQVRLSAQAFVELVELAAEHLLATSRVAALPVSVQVPSPMAGMFAPFAST